MRLSSKTTCWRLFTFRKTNIIVSFINPSVGWFASDIDFFNQLVSIGESLQFPSPLIFSSSRTEPKPQFPYTRR